MKSLKIKAKQIVNIRLDTDEENINDVKYRSVEDIKIYGVQKPENAEKSLIGTWIMF